MSNDKKLYYAGTDEVLYRQGALVYYEVLGLVLKDSKREDPLVVGDVADELELIALNNCRVHYKSTNHSIDTVLETPTKSLRKFPSEVKRLEAVSYTHLTLPTIYSV
eukprot:TRINITY_DN16381_c0_g1_i1.p1 TRINITY_DN16381_c0_g1~~TRINITY_DN16381_c0_g1_i1.p1  ORF type:complete len:107 (+),score=16.26 TRINITY_DN16381_c0_g1_i1:141-461(+)